MYEVRDGNRTLQFEGELLAQSSSWRPGQDRWVEFELYRTRSGSYVLSRIGQTRLFHDPSCAIVQRNHLRATDPADLEAHHVACAECDPFEDASVAIEKPRYFAFVSEHPDAILDALYKTDESGARYLTLVAQRLVEQAGELDTRLDKAYKVEYID